MKAVTIPVGSRVRVGEIEKNGLSKNKELRRQVFYSLFKKHYAKKHSTTQEFGQSQEFTIYENKIGTWNVQGIATKQTEIVSEIDRLDKAEEIFDGYSNLWSS